MEQKSEKETTEWNAKRRFFFGQIYVFPISQKFERI